MERVPTLNKDFKMVIIWTNIDKFIQLKIGLVTGFID